MFSNFIYFIIALIIYGTYQNSDKAFFNFFETTIFFICFISIFIGITKLRFYWIEKKSSKQSILLIDNKIEAALRDHSVLAIIFFTIDIYFLRLTSFFYNISFFKILPTIETLIFIALFMFYLVIIWSCAFPAQQKHYKTSISKASYIISNISFVLPALLPWTLISFVEDIIQLLPFKVLKDLLSTPQGEIAYFLLFFILFVITGPFFIQKLWRCVPIEKGVERERIELLCKKADIQYNNILYWPIFGGNIITAGVMGIVGKFRYILVTRAMLYFLETDEIDAVIAHEIGHVKNKHLILYFIFFLGYIGFLYTVIYPVIYFLLYSGRILWLTQYIDIDYNTLTSLLLVILVVIVFLIYFRYIFGYFMRNFERQADIYVYKLMENAKSMISTFYKIAAASGQSLEKPSWHHFSILERINYLKKCEADKLWIKLHNSKVKKIIATYIIILSTITIGGYTINYGETGKNIRLNIYKSIILDKIDKINAKTQRFTTYGDFYFSIQEYEKAVQSYKKAIMEDSKNAEALNNLAWIYATCTDKRFYDPTKALLLAQEAINVEVAPHILDTLAESYFINGNYSAAIETEMRAINMSQDKKKYYEKQLKKILKGPKK